MIEADDEQFLRIRHTVSKQLRQEEVGSNSNRLCETALSRLGGMT